MPQVLNLGPTQGQMAGEATGNLLGGVATGLSGILQGLAERKAGDMQDEQLSRILGVPKEQARGLRLLSPQLQQEMYKQQAQAPSRQLYAQLAGQALGQPSGIAALGGEAPTEAPQFQIPPGAQLNQRDFESLMKMQQKQQELAGKARKEARELDAKKQAQIAAKNKPYLERLQKEGPANAQIYDLASEAMKLLQSGNVQSGQMGKYTTGLTPETRAATERFQALIEQIAQTKLQKYGGRVSKAILESIQRSKAQPYMQPEAQFELVKKDLEDALKGIQESEALQSLLEASEGLEIPNLERKVKEYLSDQQKEQKVAKKKEPEITVEEQLVTPQETVTEDAQIPEQQLVEPEGLQEQLKKASQGTTLDEVQRFAGRTLFNVGETVAGLPGGLFGLPIDLISGAAGLFGGKLANYDEIRKKSPWLPPRQKDLQEIREKRMEDLFGSEVAEKYKPQNIGERMIDEIIGDTVALSTPIVGSAMPKLKAAAASALGNTAKYMSQAVGLSPITGEALKLGTMALTSLAGGRKRARELKNASYDAAEKAAGTDRVKASFLKTTAENALDKAQKGATSKAKETIAKDMDRLLKDFRLDDIPVQDAITWKQAINKQMRSMSKKSPEFHILKDVRDELLDTLQKYTKKNPKFVPFWTGEELSAALDAQPKFVEFIKNLNLEDKMKSKWTYGLLTGGLKGLAKVGVGSVTAAAVANAGKNAMKMMQLFNNSPQARKIYADLLKNYTANNVVAARRNAVKFDKVADKVLQKIESYKIPSAKEK